MSDGVRLYIHESSAERCIAKGIHRSGSRLRPISFNDILYGSDNATPCGVVVAVTPERIDRENWVYRVEYVPGQGTLHPVDSFVVWRQPSDNLAQNSAQGQHAGVPPKVAERIQPTEQASLNGTQPNGRKRNKKQSVNGQQGNGTQASVPSATATV